MRLAKILAVLAVGIGLCTGAFAQTYPAKPVRVIVPLPQGGGVDAVIRMVAPKLSEIWGQPVAVENHVGAGGTVATGMVARSPADGYTLLSTGNAHVVSAALRTNLATSRPMVLARF